MKTSPYMLIWNEFRKYWSKDILYKDCTLLNKCIFLLQPYWSLTYILQSVFCIGVSGTVCFQAWISPAMMFLIHYVRIQIHFKIQLNSWYNNFLYYKGINIRPCILKSRFLHSMYLEKRENFSNLFIQINVINI